MFGYSKDFSIRQWPQRYFVILVLYENANVREVTTACAGFPGSNDRIVGIPFVIVAHYGRAYAPRKYRGQEFLLSLSLSVYVCTYVRVFERESDPRRTLLLGFAPIQFDLCIPARAGGTKRPSQQAGRQYSRSKKKPRKCRSLFWGAVIRTPISFGCRQ